MVTGIVLVVSSVMPFRQRPETEILFPDVGQGDAALVELSSGKRVLIDGGGTRDNRFDLGRHALAPLLWNLGISTLDSWSCPTLTRTT
jgi:beta-lactamase superfamily II metal-dependent hydrolase